MTMTTKAQSQKAREASGAVMEYVGHLKFGLAEGKRITPQTTLEGWLDAARAEFEVNRIAVRILNATDEEMEAWVHENDDPEGMIEALTDVCERSIELIDKHKAGVEVYTAVMCRIIIIGERYHGPEIMGYTIPKRH